MVNKRVALRIHSFGVHKQGLRSSDFEDSVAYDRQGGRFAISDGASASFGAQHWSRLLVDHWVNGDISTPNHWADWLRTARDEWPAAIGEQDAAVPQYLRNRRQDDERAGHATFLGGLVTLVEDRLVLTTAAVGDSCMFLVRQGQLVASVPAELSTFEFTSYPALVSTDSAPTKPVFERFELFAGDLIYFASDALAETLRDDLGNGQNTLALLASLRSSEFIGLVDELRARSMANDDVTLLRCHVEPTAQGFPSDDSTLVQTVGS